MPSPEPRDTQLPVLDTPYLPESMFAGDGPSHLQHCYDLARARLPKEIFDEIPKDLWNGHPLGRQVVMRRFPKTTRVGRIVVPDAAQGATSAGWVLSVGPDICAPGPNVPHVWPFPLWDLVGMPVVLAAHRGTTLRLAMTQREFVGDYLQVHIGDLLAVMTSVDEGYWQAEKPSPF